MNTKKPTFNFKIDIVDFKDDKEIINSIKNLLKLSRDQDFIDSFKWDEGKKISVKVSPNISFEFSGCNCY